MSAHTAREGGFIIAHVPASLEGPTEGRRLLWGLWSQVLNPRLPFPFPQPPVHLPQWPLTPDETEGVTREG